MYVKTWDSEKQRCIISTSFADRINRASRKVNKFLDDLDAAGNLMFYRKASEYGSLLAKLNLAYMIHIGEADGTDEEVEDLLTTVINEAHPNDVVGKLAKETLEKFNKEKKMV